MTPSLNLNSTALHPTVFVVFGITGDLASRKLIPALLELYSKKLLPKRFAVIGITRRTFTRDEFREYVRTKMNVKQGQFKEEDVKHFLDNLTYEQGNFDDPKMYENLAKSISNIDEKWGQCSNKLFHLSVPPTLYEGILMNISKSGLSKACDDGIGWTRILIEKPFGNDIKTAKSLDKLLGKLFNEKQIFRIDHYLAKESLQNIVAFRFGNSLFEPLWRKQYIDKVHVKLYEKIGMEGRGAFYDPVGALKDVGQNHMLAMLALIAMERPVDMSAESVSLGRAKVLRRLKPIPRRSLAKQVVRAQYDGYQSESGVKKESQTETYFRIQAFVNSPRWQGVPFYLESGKALSDAKTEIDIYFKNLDAKNDLSKQNILTFRIQPDEGIKIRFFVKVPGYSTATESKPLRFKYSDNPLFHDIPDDYERLIHDAFAGDQTLFASTEEIMASWKFVTSIIENWDSIPLKKYNKGSKEII